MNREQLESQLLLLPNEIAEESRAIMNLLVEKNKADIKIDEIEAIVKFQIGTDKALTNDTARKGAIKDALAQNTDYEKYSSIRHNIKTSLDLAVIEHQRKRDGFNALIAIAGIR